MRDFLHTIFKSYEVSEDSFWYADAFTIWHAVYAVIIVAAIVGAAFALNRASDKTKKRVLDILPIVVIGLYIFDLFIRPISGLEIVEGNDFQQSILQKQISLCHHDFEQEYSKLLDERKR